MVVHLPGKQEVVGSSLTGRANISFFHFYHYSFHNDYNAPFTNIQPTRNVRPGVRHAEYSEVIQ